MSLTDYTDDQLRKSIEYCSDVILGIRKSNTHLFTPERALDALVEYKQERARRGVLELEFCKE